MSVNKKFWALSAVFSLILLSVFAVGVPPPLEPDTDITYIKEFETSLWIKCISDDTYVPYEEIIIKGISRDLDLNLTSLQYLRDEWNWNWHDAIPVKPPINDIKEEWYTEKQSSSFTDGWHRVCGRATDSGYNQENPMGDDVYDVPDDDCCNFCVDTQEPDQVENIVHSNPSNCVSNYVNEAPEFSWDAAEDNGCAGIEEYEVKVYYSNGTPYYETTTSSTSITISGPSGLINGEDYYIKVRAVDKAGNKGDWSGKSEDVYYDTEKPEVEITTSADGWIKGDFEVSETDEDNLELWKCYYKIENDGIVTLDWNKTACNEDILIDVSEYCPVDGWNNCHVYKKAVDNACNERERWKEFDTDNNPPTTTKIVGEPKYFYGEPNDWWIKPWTNFSLGCYDTGSGCQTTYYNIDGGDFMVYEGEFNLEGYEAGVHVICYYSTDNIDNTETQVCEFDYIDLIDPTIEKSEDILYQECHDFNLSGKPEYVIGGEESVLIWKEENLWKLRWTDDWSNQVWSNVIIKIITGSPIDYFKEYQFEGNQEHPDDYSNVGNQIIYVDSWVDNQEDGIEFSQEDDSALVGFEIYYNGVLDSNKVFLGGERANPEKNPFMINTNRYVSDSTLFTLNADDEGSGLSNSYYRIDETCHWETYVAPFNLSGHYEGIHEIEYYAEDNLKQLSEIKKQIVILDKTAPEIKILNPTPEETKVEKCVQSIVAIVTDEGSGIKRVWAELYDDEGLVDSVDMELTVYGTYEALMDKALPAGEYTLIVHAEDNVENSAKEEIFETLTPGVFVEYIEDPICVINPETGGECDFIFHICMRESDSVKMWMDKLGDVVTPAMMNAEISNTEGSAYVGLMNKTDKLTEAGLLSYGEEINGRTNFKLHLDVPSDVASMIGAGSHTLDYLIESYLE